jgi:hypothetical protein
MRGLILALAIMPLGMSAHAAPAASSSPAPAAQTVERCKTTPNFCKALIREAASRANAAKDACIPSDVSEDDAAERIMHAIADILEEDPDLNDFSYAVLAGQILAFLYPCDVIS